MSEWPTLEVSELISKGALIVGDGYRAKNQELSRTGLPFARAGNVNDGFRFVGADCFPETNLSRVGNKVSESGDVVFTSKGTVGRFALVRAQTPRFVYSPQLCFWRSVKPELIDPKFLFFWMSGSEFYGQFKGVSGQTDMAEYVSLTDQRRMKITLPPIDEQHAIASILGALDDKIDINRRMNETLEAMARAIFRDWFVDFGPTRAKMEGRAPYLAPEIWSVFPDILDNEAKPQGWERIVLRDAADVLSGGTPAKDCADFWNGSIPWISPKVMTAMHVSDSEDRVTPQAIGHGTRLAPPGSVLVMVRGMGLHQGVRVSQARCDVAFNQDVKALVPQRLSGTHLLFGMLDAAPYLFSKVEASEHGTGKLPTDVVDSVDFITPTGAAYKRLIPALDALNDRIAANNAESITLSTLRDLLLPKLMSGEIRLKDAANPMRDVA
jgi:type I restriction enzyme, S subunit